MILRSSLLCLLFVAPLTAQQGDEAGSRSIFDGSLDDWHGDPRFWSVEDGVLVGETTALNPLAATTYLTWTGGEVADFELRVRFRILGGNSGVQFRSIRKGEYGVAGYQADMEDGTNWIGCLYEQDGRGVVARRGQRVEFSPSGEKTVEQQGSDAEILAVMREHEWNDYVIRAVGAHVEIFLNGVRTVELIDRDEERARSSGVLALQLHQGPPMRVEFKDLRLLDLGGQGAESEAAAEPEPEWIWSSIDPGADETLWTCSGMTVREGFESATLWGSCDNVAEVFLNGALVAATNDWAVPFRVDVTKKIQAGPNSLAAWGRNQGGPAGLWLKLRVEYPDGHQETLVTDSSWLVSNRASDGWMDATGSRDGWTRATRLGELGVAPWGTATAFSDGSGEQALPAEELELLAGFEAELLYSVPKGEQGSWVSLTFDDRGRLIASDQYGALYRMLPPPLGEAAGEGNGEFVVEALDVDLGRAHGLLYAFDSLYVVVAEGQGTGLYRLRDTNGDDRYDDVKFLKAFAGSGEHGPHAVILGPDGRSLYIVGGNHTRLPQGITRFRPTTVWEEDQLLPRRTDPNGHAVSIRAPGGWVVRTDPDGEQWELVAIGMRNSYDIAFHPTGELFTFDSDMEWDVGLPWYRPTRILNLVSGADFGWRTGSGKFPAHYPDSLPGAVDLGLTSPTGVVFGTETAFHGPYREAFFAADWAYGTIYAVHLRPNGASFVGEAEVFAQGKPFQVTDLAVGPDGALYVTTGGRRTQSGLYRIRSTRDPAPEPQAEINGFLAARRVIERDHGLEGPSTFWKELGSADRFIAHAARTAIEQSDAGLWAERALAEEDPRVALQALIGLIRTHPDEYGVRVLARAQEFPLEDWDAEVLLPWTRLFGLTCVRAGHPAADVTERLAARFEKFYPSGDRDLDFELCRLQVYLQAPTTAEKTLDLLEASTDSADQIHYAFALRTLTKGWTLPLRRRYFRWLNEVAPKINGGNSLAKYVASIRSDAVELLPAELAASQDLLIEPPALEGVRTLEASAKFVREWTMADLAPHLGELKSGRNFEQGASAFRRTTCLECHRFAGEGGGTGPGLTGAGSRFNPRDMLEALLEPSVTISDQYQETEVQTRDERVIVGIVERETDELLVLRTVAPREESVEIDKQEIAMRRLHPLSRMPAGLLDTLTLEEILDLLAYSLSSGERDDPVFRQ